ncbi:MAG: hypothetical protein IH591_11595, partial [Bacteroidales bacterium]|nr:hypothetical protein [Bacteroidales bacterium]
EFNDVVILFSGAVYNRVELNNMVGSGPQLPVPSLVARLFARSGPQFVKDLNGDFAICICQPRKKRVFLFRDHVGIRPMAYSAEGESLCFSTDITGLCRAVSGGMDIDTVYLTGHFRYIDYRKTPSAKVRKLSPGHWLEFSEAGIKTVRYWEPEKMKPDRRMTYGRMIEALGTIVRDAIQIRCDSRFTAGAHVSGGLDSGYVSLLTRKEYRQQERFFGFSWSPFDYLPRNICHDERELVAGSCDEAGITPVLSDMDAQSFPGAVVDYYKNHGYFSEYCTAVQAAARGVNLIFSGWGGDEFISTSAPAMEWDLLRSLKIGLYLKRNQFKRPKRFIKNLVHYVLFPVFGILDRATARSFCDDARYLKREFRNSDRRAIRQFYFHTSRHGHHLGMLDFYHLQERCESWYGMGFRMGIEYRYPLLDRRIIEFILRVPSVILCRTGQSRPVLRELGRDLLPEEVRLNSSKNDPVLWSFMDDLYREASISFMEEVNQWRKNSDLGFIDFDLLSGDISRYRSGSPEVREKVLFRALVYIKAIHEFTLRYHETV